MDIYHFDHVTGEYLGQGEADESPLEPGVYLMSAHATTIAPPAAEAGNARVWTGAAWAQAPDHRGEAGYVAGQAVTITDIGPLPAGWSVSAPEPTEAELAVLRRAAITAELTALDAASARPLRAILAVQAAGGEADAADVARLAELEAQAVALRAELAALGA